MVARTRQPTMRTGQLNIRIPDTHRELVDRVATSMGVTRTQFILDAVRDRAEDYLAQQVVVRLDRESFDELQAVLDGPVVIPDGLRDLMSRRPPWESAT